MAPILQSPKELMKEENKELGEKDVTDWTFSCWCWMDGNEAVDEDEEDAEEIVAVLSVPMILRTSSVVVPSISFETLVPLSFDSSLSIISTV
jgi:hypothetical protein